VSRVCGPGTVKQSDGAAGGRKIPNAWFEPALGAATLCALAVETDDAATGLARRVGAVRLGGRLEEARPTFWE
jgi:2',3'-cyclic-nucleotide 2'-phosphodiesterase